MTAASVFSRQTMYVSMNLLCKYFPKKEQSQRLLPFAIDFNDLSLLMLVYFAIQCSILLLLLLLLVFKQIC